VIRQIWQLNRKSAAPPGFGRDAFKSYTRRKGEPACSVMTEGDIAMTLRINSEASNFTAETTEGKINFPCGSLRSRTSE